MTNDSASAVRPLSFCRLPRVRATHVCSAASHCVNEKCLIIASAGHGLACSRFGVEILADRETDR